MKCEFMCQVVEKEMEYRWLSGK